MADERFAFGRNWQSYLSRTVPAERVAVAGAWLSRFLGAPELAGLSFLDIGSGSGLHSLAAVRAGAARVVSFDYDPASVAATRSLWRLAGAPDHWQVLEGSVLDGGFMAGLGRFDVVYAWGVLHHTGDQWQALRHARARVGERGRLYLALYASEHHLDPEAVLARKRRYNQAGPLVRAALEADYVWATVCRRRWPALLRLPALARAYRESRGMAIVTDARDWLGGWPMAFSSVAEVHRAVAAQGDGRDLAMVKVRTGEANTEYLFAAPTLAEQRCWPGLRPDQVAAARLPRLASVAALPEDGRYVIFGTAAGAERLAAAARRAGRPPRGFIDLARDGQLAGLPVQRFADFAAPADTLVVLSNAHVQDNADRLERAGYTNLVNAHPLVVAMMAGYARG